MGSLGKSAPSPLLDLAQKVFVNAYNLSEELSAEGLPLPSFDANGPINVAPSTASTAAQSARVAVAEAAFKLFQLASGPSELLPNMTASYQTMFALRWLIHFDIFSHIPLDKPTTYSTIATAANVPESQLRAIAREAMTSFILAEPELNQVVHTAASAMFIHKPLMLDWANYMFGASIPTAQKMVEQTQKWPGSVKKNETAYNLAFGHEMDFFQHLSASPELTKQFSGYMKSVTDGRGTDLAHMIHGFDWAGLPENALVIDVGGSTGHGTFALAEAYPNLRFEVQDLEKVAANGNELLKTQPEAIASRVSFRSHSFFDPQPVEGADVYFLRMIIHDWADAEALKIISQLAPALKPHSKIVLMDTVLPTPGQIPVTKERVLRVRDLTMRQVFNSKERSLDDFEDLLKGVDSRLKLERAHQPDGSHMSLLTVGI